jgi:tetratricopeptide (TPR) repeat protein
MSSETKKNFFISYHKADRSWAEWIAWHLEEAGYTTVLQAWDFLPGTNFVLEMQRSTAEAQRTIAVLSPDYLTSSFTQPEWTAAFAGDPTGEKGLLLPIRVRECDPTALLPQLVYIDILGLEDAAARNSLLEGVGKGRRKPANKPSFPGAPKRSTSEKPRFRRVWNVPDNRNPNFTGRTQLLDDLRGALTSDQPATLIQALTGLGGVGKTQIALEYAYRYRAEYEIVWWVRAEEPATLAADFAVLATELDLPARNASEQTAIVKAVRHWLSQTTRQWLLIFDNAQKKDITGYLPQGVVGHVLITSRTPSWRAVAGDGVLRVRLMKPEEAVEFLIKRTGSADAQTALALAEELGFLPLALEQAGAYIEETSISRAEYLNLFQTEWERLLRVEPDLQQRTVATTWEISFEKVKQESPAAEDLLSLCAFLAPDEIPLKVLTRKERQSQHLTACLAKAIKKPGALIDVISALRRYSLVKVATENYLLSVHRLVQAVRRTRLSEQDRERWAKRAVVLLNEAFRFDPDEEAWPACSRLLPHALAATKYAYELHVAYEETGQLLTALGKYFVGRSEFASVKAAFEQALAIDEKFHGRDHHTVAEDATRLGFLLKNHGDLLAAKPYFEKALKIYSKSRASSRSKFAESLNNLGILLKDLGDFDGAQKKFDQGLKINEEEHGAESSQVAVNLNNLGSLLKDKDDLDAAQSHFERALEINRKAHADDLSVATNLNNLGIIAKDKGDLATALRHFENALNITEQARGPNHEDFITSLVTSLRNLGYLRKDRGEAEAAGEYFERALKITEREYGPNHPEVATSLNNLAYLLRDEGDLEVARDCFERALSINELAHGPDHPIVGSTLKNLADLADATGDLAGARTYVQRALEIDQAAYGSNHVMVAMDLTRLGSILQRQRDTENARSRYEQAAKILQRVLGNSDPRTLEAKNNLASLGKERAVGR